MAVLFWLNSIQALKSSLSQRLGLPDTIHPSTQLFLRFLGNGWYRISQGYSHLGGAASASVFQASVFVKADGASVIKMESFIETLKIYVDGTSTTGFLVWGAQLEESPFPTSYIPTAASTATRAADVAVITGANFYSWYNQSQGTFYGQWTYQSPPGFFLATGLGVNDLNSNWAMLRSAASLEAAGLKSVKVTTGLTNYNAIGGSAIAYQNGPDETPVGLSVFTPNLAPNEFPYKVIIGAQTVQINGSIRRIAFYPVRLVDPALQYLTSYLGSPSSTTYPYTFTITGKDTLALNGVSNASTRNFVFIKGLSSTAQPRLAAVAATTSSGLAAATNALPKLSPISSGNYLFASGITLSGVTTRINGTNALSIATSPFSGSTAITPLLFSELRPQANWRITEPMPSGTIASPEFAIPFETNDFVLFMKAGQS